MIRGLRKKENACIWLEEAFLFVCKTLNNQHLQCICEIDGRERKKIRTELNNVKWDLLTGEVLLSYSWWGSGGLYRFCTMSQTIRLHEPKPSSGAASYWEWIQTGVVPSPSSLSFPVCLYFLVCGPECWDSASLLWLEVRLRLIHPAKGDVLVRTEVLERIPSPPSAHLWVLWCEYSKSWSKHF